MPSSITDELAEIVERLQEQESLDWEVKAAAGGIPNALWETVSSFANTSGGWIILGIRERDGKQIVDGISNTDLMLRQLHDQMRNSAKISHPVCGATDIFAFESGSKDVIAVRVPPAPRRSRPVFTRGNPYSGTYLRRNEGDYPATRPEVDRMMREASEIGADQVILDGYSWDDLDAATIQGYRRRFQTAQPTSPHNSLPDEEFLKVIGAYRRDRELGRSGITVAGLLMFGKDEAIRSWRSRHIIDYRVVSGDPTHLAQADWIDRIVWEGNLLGAFERIYNRLIEGIPRPFSVVNGVRVDENEQHVAIREAFVNLLLHADYREQAASLVISSNEGYFFRNPGNSRIPDLNPSLGDRSDPRNPELVRMFRLIGFAEEAGSGVPRIVQAWRKLGYESPLFDVGVSRYEFSAELRFTHLLLDQDRDWLEALEWPLTEPQQLALVAARHEGYVDNGMLRELTGMHPADVTRMLGELRDSGLLQMIGGGRGAKYQLDPAVLLVDDSSYSGSGKFSHVNMSSTPAVLDTAESAVSSTAGLSEGSLDSIQSLIDDPIWPDLDRIAMPVSVVDYVSAGERNRVVLELCSVKPLSLLELTWLLRRNKAYIRSILKELIQAGQLTYIYPDSPRHPRQRYKTT